MVDLDLTSPFKTMFHHVDGVIIEDDIAGTVKTPFADQFVNCSPEGDLFVGSVDGS